MLFIWVVNVLYKPAEITFIGDTNISGSLIVGLSGSGFIQAASGSFFSGSGENLFNIPRSALVEDALLSNLITTGSVTASVSTDIDVNHPFMAIQLDQQGQPHGHFNRSHGHNHKNEDLTGSRI